MYKRQHILVALNGRCRLIDFGISLNLDQHPNLGREEVHNFVRTLPMYRVFLGMAEDQNHVDRFLDEYAQKLAASEQSEITSRDLQFAEQGIKMAMLTMGEKIGEPVKRGFLNGYYG